MTLGSSACIRSTREQPLDGDRDRLRERRARFPENRPLFSNDLDDSDAALGGLGDEPTLSLIAQLIEQPNRGVQVFGVAVAHARNREGKLGPKILRSRFGRQLVALAKLGLPVL